MSDLGDLWLCDRSRYDRGLGQCNFARFKEYHSGPHGYGIRPKAQSVYASTGIYLHDVAKGIVDIFSNDWGSDIAKYRNDVRKVIHATVARYYRLIDARGFCEGDAAENIRIVEEQAALVEALGWIYYHKLLPWLMKEFELVSAELEEEMVADCTCGLPPGIGDFADHVARNCTGIGWMSRLDLILKRRSDGAVGWHEYKTSSNPHQDTWIAGWADNVQFASGLVAAERRLGYEISHYYVHGFDKGRRKRMEYDPETRKYGGPKKQDTFLCYAYYKPGNPPLGKEEWRTSSTWDEYDEKKGRVVGRKLGKGYSKREVWKGNFEHKPPDQSAIEHWIEWLGPERWDEKVVTIGPYNRPTHLISEWLLEMPANERRWQQKLWDLYEARQQAAADIGANATHPRIEAHPIVQLALRRLFPRNWSGCKGYFGDDCEYTPICYKKPGWDDPLGSDLFVPRRPHHDPEVNQMVSRGIPVPDQDDALEHSNET
jgi:hypothetical protein